MPLRHFGPMWQGHAPEYEPRHRRRPTGDRSSRRTSASACPEAEMRPFWELCSGRIGVNNRTIKRQGTPTSYLQSKRVSCAAMICQLPFRLSKYRSKSGSGIVRFRRSPYELNFRCHIQAQGCLRKSGPWHRSAGNPDRFWTYLHCQKLLLTLCSVAPPERCPGSRRRGSSAQFCCECDRQGVTGRNNSHVLVTMGAEFTPVRLERTCCRETHVVF